MRRGASKPTSAGNAIAQAAAIAALTDHDYLVRSKGLVSAAKNQFESMCTERGIRFIPSAANFILIGVDDGAKTAAALQEKGIIVRPLAPYGLSNWIRVTYGLMQENLHFFEALDELAACRT